MGQIMGALGQDGMNKIMLNNALNIVESLPFLKDEEISLYQSFIGTLRWGVELGRIELTFAVSLMSRFSTAPRTDHMQKLLHMFSYIKRHLDSKLVFDAGTRDWSHINFLQHDWNEFYPDAMETMPPNAPEPRGRAVQLNMFCDAAHANDHVTRRSTTGLVIFILGTLILWYSKRQNTIETSTFGSEFVALRIAVELIEALIDKLRMLGVPVEGPTNVLCDNKSVVTNSTEPASVLKKKHNAIAYHKVREAVAAGIIRVAHIKSHMNVADILTKPLSPQAYYQILKWILFKRDSSENQGELQEVLVTNRSQTLLVIHKLPLPGIAIPFPGTYRQPSRN